MSNPARSVLAAASAAVANRLAIPAPSPVPAVATAGVLAPDGQPATAPGNLPSLTVIVTTLAAYYAASEAGRLADRGKRAGRKLINLLPDGVYGPWLVTREDSGRETLDGDEIARIFAANDLGAVPTRAAAPSLKVVRIPSADVVDTTTGEIHGNAA